MNIKKTTSITLIFDLRSLAFLGIGDDALFHLSLGRLVTRSYSKIHSAYVVQFQVLSKRLDTIAHDVPFAHHSATLVPFFTQIFLIPRSSVIVYTLLLFTLLASMNLTVWRRSLHTFFFTRSTFSFVLLVVGLPLLGSSFRSFLLCFCATLKSELLTSWDLHSLLGAALMFYWSFSKPNEKLEVDLLFDAHCLPKEKQQKIYIY